MFSKLFSLLSTSFFLVVLGDENCWKEDYVCQQGTTGDAQSCSRMCQKIDACTHWTFDRYKICFLFQGETTKLKSKSFDSKSGGPISGLKDTAEGDFAKGQVYGYSKKLKANLPETCRDWCQQAGEDCGWWNLVSDDYCVFQTGACSPYNLVKASKFESFTGPRDCDSAPMVEPKVADCTDHYENYQCGLGGGTAEDCQKMCDNVADCGSWFFDIFGKCFMHRGTPSYKKKNFDSKKGAPMAGRSGSPAMAKGMALQSNRLTACDGDNCKDVEVCRKYCQEAGDACKWWTTDKNAQHCVFMSTECPANQIKRATSFHTGPKEKCKEEEPTGPIIPEVACAMLKSEPECVDEGRCKWKKNKCKISSSAVISFEDYSNIIKGTGNTDTCSNIGGTPFEIGQSSFCQPEAVVCKEVKDPVMCEIIGCALKKNGKKCKGTSSFTM